MISIEKDDFFEKLEGFMNEIGNKKLEETFKLTILYSTGDKDIFNVSFTFWAEMMIVTKNRLKYLYFQNRLINLEHVVKMEYKDLSK